MASSKRLGFFWGDDKLTLVDFEKNSPLHIVVSPLGLRTATPSPFASTLTEEIQITAILKKMLEDNQIADGAFYVSLPMKEIILRSFVIPFVKPDDLQNAVKYEAKRYIPFDIQDLSYVFHTIPFMEEKNKRLQVIFYAARKEVLARYERIFEQVNMKVAYGEPYIVSLAKALIFRKEINPTGHLAFLILEKNLGRICFIDKGIPQFIREFPITISSMPEAIHDSQEDLNTKIVNEVGNSFDFYTRQFTGERVEQVLVSSEFVQKDLMAALEAELKIKITEFSPVINLSSGQSKDMDAIYAMGACVTPPIDSLSKFNFIEDKSARPKLEFEIFTILKPYKEIIFVFVACIVFLIIINVFFWVQSVSAENQFKKFTAKEGQYLNTPLADLQSDIQANTDKLGQYKSIRTKSDVAVIILKISSHLPLGTLLHDFKISYNQGDTTTGTDHVVIEIDGVVTEGEFNDQIGVVNKMFSDFKNDKELNKFISNVSLVSLSREVYNNKQVTAFTIHFS